jgi:hypothetical protein
VRRENKRRANGSAAAQRQALAQKLNSGSAAQQRSFLARRQQHRGASCRVGEINSKTSRSDWKRKASAGRHAHDIVHSESIMKAMKKHRRHEAANAAMRKRNQQRRRRRRRAEKYI